MLLLGRLLLDQVDLVLEDEDVLQLHDLDGCKMLGGLRLGTRLIACHLLFYDYDEWEILVCSIRIPSEGS